MDLEPAARSAWSTRLKWLAILLIVQCLYFPINRIMKGGVILEIPWDAYFPLRPVWIAPYLLSLAWWTGCYIWAAWKMADRAYQALFISVITVALISYAIYILYPTYVVRPAVEPDGLASRWVVHLYANDRVNNAFPSGHTYNTVLVTLYWSRFYPRGRPLWVAIAVVILLSTLYTRQHNLPDLLGGIVLACFGYWFGLWWTGRHQMEAVS
ncbi:MAG: phosphatase PAP2 family protein [Anaerolineae bacterium]|jgi:membrane-associated phospholipid phosphatase